MSIGTMFLLSQYCHFLDILAPYKPIKLLGCVEKFNYPYTIFLHKCLSNLKQEAVLNAFFTSLKIKEIRVSKN
ncbi:hypothetical protein DP115_29485 [Brasilonema octagenarum UFV-OR1]|uniref:Uncharacterized protein n=1 Tax=Brasilonema octagenarum UFV-OR1 TaxID=417115 RepID=A0ABX1MIG3_9CYAN|nr:hypothetical protein [Brasilonema octagenarum UFV-OR1]